MKKSLLAIVFAFLCGSSFGQTFNENYGSPIVVLYETDPWLMVIGSDVPIFALYENGQIIYRKTIDRQHIYFEIKNDREETQKIIKSFGISDDLMKQEDYIEASTRTDQPSNILILNFEELKEIHVYGDLRHQDNEDRKNVPTAFLNVYDNILKFEDSRAVEWLPEQIEVLATAYGHSPERPLKWNNAWDDLNSPTTVQRSEQLYSIYLAQEHYTDLLKLMKSLKEKQAVEINGKKFSLSYRLPFPNLR